MSSQNPTRSSDQPERPTPLEGARPAFDTIQQRGRESELDRAGETYRPESGYPATTSTSTLRDMGSVGTEDSSMKDKVAGAAGTAKDKVSGVASSATEKVDAQRDSVAGSLDTVATTLRDKAETIPGGEKTTQAAQTAAAKIEHTASYLREHEVSDMMGDVERLVRQHPVESLLIAAAAGFLVGRAVRR